MRKKIAFAAALTTLFISSGSAPRAAQEPDAHGTQKASAVLPADDHEGLSISADAYTDSARAKSKFGKKANPVAVGILPVEVILRNHSTRPVRVDLKTIQITLPLRDGERQELDSMAVRDVARLIVHPRGSEPEAKLPRIQIGVPTGADPKVEKMAALIEPFALEATIVGPNDTEHGFVFFHLGRAFDLAAHSSLYVPDVFAIPENKPLMFFEVPLSAASTESQ